MTTSTRGRTATLPAGGVAVAVGFLLAYLAVTVVQAPLSDRDLPLPAAPPAETAAYYDANPMAAMVVAALQAVSVICFAVFVGYVAPALRQAAPRAGTRLTVVGGISVTAMLVSSLLTCALVVVASSASLDVVDGLRQASFYAGGVGNVVALGGFVFGTALVLGRRGLLGQGSRWFGYVAGTLAMLSVLSVVAYYASPFLPVGRVLSMVWAVVAGIALFRRTRIQEPTTTRTGAADE